MATIDCKLVGGDKCVRALGFGNSAFICVQAWTCETGTTALSKVGYLKEAIALRKPMWNIRLRERDGEKFRVIMWDMTGVMTCKFGATDTQRTTYSKYYTGNCVKGGNDEWVVILLDGWAVLVWFSSCG